MNNKIYTIGYSGFSIDDFIETLKDNSINVIIDVRSMAYSERYADYNKDHLETKLKNNHIYYRNYITEFGARQENPLYYNSNEGYLDFEKFSLSAEFQLGVKKICDSLEQGYRICLMCAEKNPIQCHRTILVARSFFEKGYEIIHIIPGGNTLTQNQIEEELLRTYFPQRGQLSLFSNSNMTEKDYICEAYRMQNKKIGYKKGESVL